MTLTQSYKDFSSEDLRYARFKHYDWLKCFELPIGVFKIRVA